MTTPTPAAPVGRYRALWNRALGTSGYLLAVFPLSITALAVLSSIFFTGVGTLILLIGVPLVVASLHVARGFGSADRALLQLTGLPPVAEPSWPRADPNASWLSRLMAPLRSAHHWSYLLHQMLISPIIATVSFSLVVTWWSGALGGLTYVAWQGFLPDREPASDWPAWIAQHVPFLGGWASRAVESGLYLTSGILFALTLPWVVGGLGRVHHGVARALLGRWANDDLAERARGEAAARQAAVHAEGSAMRRLERDLHDGPQQRIVRLQLDLAAAERRAAAGDSEQAAHYAREAQEQAKAALDELRALSRGVAPPLLADRGLLASLQALAEDAPIPVRTRLDPALDGLASDDVERAVYFIVAELLTNVTKHSGATEADLSAEVRLDDPLRLRLVLVDNGRGGARFADGHGLAGLRDRAHGLRGTLTLESPEGGPTRVEVTVPLTEPTLSA